MSIRYIRTTSLETSRGYGGGCNLLSLVSDFLIDLKTFQVKHSSKLMTTLRGSGYHYP